MIVAKRYGISDVGLAKICKKLSIPLPTRGYWAKLKAGQIMKKMPLPKLKESSPQDAVMSQIDPVRKAAETVAKQKIISHGADLEKAMTVLTELIDPHPLVKAAGKRLRQREGVSDEKGLRAAPAEVLHLQVSSSFPVGQNSIGTNSHAHESGAWPPRTTNPRPSLRLRSRPINSGGPSKTSDGTV